MPFCSPHVSWLYRLSGSFTWQSDLPRAFGGLVRRAIRRSRESQGSKLEL